MIYGKIIGIISFFLFTSCSLLLPEEKNEWISENEYPIIPGGNAKLIDVNKIWDAGHHNAFTDLVSYNDSLFITFREGKTHNTYDGSIRVIKSKQGDSWESVTLKSHSKVDLRDPKLSISHDNKLYLFSSGRFINESQEKVSERQTYSWIYNNKTKEWSERNPIYKKGIYWLWNVRWLNQTAYSIGYTNGAKRWISVFRKDNYTYNFSKISEKIYANYKNYDGNPGETDFLFLNDDLSISLVRRNGPKENTSLVGFSYFPFTDWQWKDTNVIIGGPKLLQLPDGRIIAAVRRYENEKYDGKRRTSLCWLDPVNARLTEFLELPSGNDNGYPGMIWNKDHLLVSYYSGHEGGKASIYLAKVDITLQSD